MEKRTPDPKRGFLMKSGGGTRTFGSTSLKRRYFELDKGIITWCLTAAHNTRAHALDWCRKDDEKDDKANGSMHVLSIMEASQRHGTTKLAKSSPL